MTQKASDRRVGLRFDKVFTVYLSTGEGLTRGMGRNISTQGMYVETREAMPLGQRLKVTLLGEDGTELTCHCEVRYQVALNYAGAAGDCRSRGVGLRILAYETHDDPLFDGPRVRTLH